MILRREFEPSGELPAQARYWVPPAEELDIEGRTGIGFFHDVRLILNVPPDEAQHLAADERTIMRIVDEVSPDAATFERLATLVEFYDPDDVDSLGVQPTALERLDQYLHEWSPLEGLELGVAGLTHALASIGCVPAASCRSHFGPISWSERPVVYAAIDRPRAQWLQPLVQGSRCGFGIDGERPDLLVIEAPSIVEMIGLTSAILLEAETSWPPSLCRTFEPVPEDDE